MMLKKIAFDIYVIIQRCVALWVQNICWCTLFEKQLDEPVVALGSCSVKRRRVQLVSSIGVCSIFQQQQGNLQRGNNVSFTSWTPHFYIQLFLVSMKYPFSDLVILVTTVMWKFHVRKWDWKLGQPWLEKKNLSLK